AGHNQILNPTDWRPEFPETHSPGGVTQAHCGHWPAHSSGCQLFCPARKLGIQQLSTEHEGYPHLCRDTQSSSFVLDILPVRCGHPGHNSRDVEQPLSPRPTMHVTMQREIQEQERRSEH